MKRADGWRVRLRTEQIGWLRRRARLGGRCFVAVRRAGSELYLYSGADAGLLFKEGIRGSAVPLVRLEGGEAQWDWSVVRSVLTGG